MVTVDSFWIKEDKMRILIRVWKPKKKIIGVIHLIHGMTEHSGFYHEWSALLTKMGLIVIAHDHPGSGLTVQRDCQLGQLPMNGKDIVMRAMKCVDNWINENLSC